MSRGKGKGTIQRGSSRNGGNWVVGLLFFVLPNSKLALVFYQTSGSPISCLLIVGFPYLYGEPTHLERSISPMALVCTGKDYDSK